MWDNLPSDIAVRIICKLPIKELLRFTSINKSSYDLIHSKSFVDFYSHHVPDPPVIFVKSKPSSLFHTDANPSDEINFPPLPFQNPNCQLVSSCNGVVCLHDRRHKRLILWNPYIQKVITLPNPNNTLQGYVFGLGFVDSDYKVLMINQTNEAEVYSLRRNCWKIVANPVPLSNSIDCVECECVKGSMYWMSSRGNVGVLGVFELKDEVFREIRLPERWNGVDASRLDLLVPTESSIGVFRVPEDDEDDSMDVFSDNKWITYVQSDDDDDICWTGTVRFIYLNKKGEVKARLQDGRFIGVSGAHVNNLALLDQAGKSSTAAATRRSSRLSKRRKIGESSKAASNGSRWLLVRTNKKKDQGLEIL
ncbi:F-box and associated interaction domains-containing protein [Euphorbia peplus]|nr:F-box and associated interaction domains-containing protein [Euphorbia peplus]